VPTINAIKLTYYPKIKDIFLEKKEDS